MFRFIFAFVALVVTGGLHAADELFDKNCSIEIVESSIEIYPPGKACPLEPLSETFRHFWCIRYRIDFNNGIYASNVIICDDIKLYPHLTERKYSGNVNIVSSDFKKTGSHFALLFEKGNSLSVDLWVDDFEKHIHIPTMRSLQPMTKIIPHWFYEEKKYEYIIGLSDGTTWLSPEFDDIWYPWPLSSRVLRVGTTTDPILINLDTVYEDYPRIVAKDYLKVKKS